MLYNWWSVFSRVQEVANCFAPRAIVLKDVRQTETESQYEMNINYDYVVALLIELNPKAKTLEKQSQKKSL